MIKRYAFTILLLVSTLLSMGQGRRVLFIGDSITDGAWGNANVWNATSDERNQTDMNHIYGHGYMMIAAAQCEALMPEYGWKFWNRGISGNTLDDLAYRWQHDVLELKPDIVSVLVGTNDVEQALNDGRTINPVEWGNSLRTLLDKVLEQNPQAKFMLCTPFVAKVGWRGESESYNLRQAMISNLVEVIKEVNNDYPSVLVPFDTLVADSIAATPDLPASYWIWDGIHPTPAMHYKMAMMWIEKLNLIL